MKAPTAYQAFLPPMPLKNISSAECNAGKSIEVRRGKPSFRKTARAITSETMDKRIPDKKPSAVRFASTKTVCYYRGQSKEERKKLWYQQKDYMSFDKDRRHTISAVHHVYGDLTWLDPEKYCILGLEQQLTREQMMDRKKRIVRYQRAVLEQQYYQRYVMGVEDPHTLKDLSAMLSHQSLAKAHLRAVIQSGRAA